MKRALFFACMLIGLLGSAPLVSAQKKTPSLRPDEEHFAGLSLNNGVSLGFIALRLSDEQESRIGGQVVPTQSDEVTRLLLDEQHQLCFGYQIEAQRATPANLRLLRVHIQPMEAKTVAEIQKSKPNFTLPSNCQTLPPAGKAPLRVIQDGEVITLDLMVKPATGEKIIDVIQVSGEEVERGALDAVCKRTSQAARHVREADVFIARGSYEQAAAAYQKALALAPYDATAHNRLGNVYQQLHKTDLAQKEYQQAVRLNPQYAEAWNNLGTAYHARASYKRAIRNYKQAIEIRPERAVFHSNLGSAYMAQGDFDAALAAYQEAHRLNPNIMLSGAQSQTITTTQPNAGLDLFIFAKLNAAQGKVDEAIRLLTAAQAKGFKDFDRVARDSDFRAVVADPRYRVLVSGHGR